MVLHTSLEGVSRPQTVFYRPGTGDRFKVGTSESSDLSGSPSPMVPLLWCSCPGCMPHKHGIPDSQASFLKLSPEISDNLSSVHTSR